MSAIHGKDRVEAVTIAQIDKRWDPIAGTEKTIECDTLLISAGLIPENELSRMAGIELDPVTGGPVVDNNMETSVPGFFAGGNVLHVNDLVDNVSREAEIAGTSAANFAMGKIPTQKPKLRLRAGENIRYIMPQTINLGEEVTLSMRVKEPADKVRIKVGPILTKGFRVVKPSEMVQVTISSQEWQKISFEINELVVDCESRR